MQKILVTGGAGNVGSSLVKRLSLKGKFDITVVDDFSTGSPDKLIGADFNNISIVKADVNNFNDISTIMISRSFDYVFHYAAVVGVSRTLSNPIKVLHDIEGIKNILDIAKNTGVKRVFYSSSSEVYGEPVEFPQNEETTPLNSRLPYAIVKNVGESFFKSYYKQYGLNYTVFRFFNTYGPLQSSDFVIPKFIERAIKGLPIPIYGDGLQTRTFCYIDDNTEATCRILEGDLFLNDIVNIGNDFELTVLDLANLVIKITNSKSLINFMPPLEEGDMTRRMPDISKMKSILKRELVDIETGLKLTYDSIRSKN